MENNFFVVVSSPRCGSNYLCSLLGSHPDVLCHNEIFHHQEVGVNSHYLPHKSPLKNMQWRDKNPGAFVTQLLAESIAFSPKIKLVGCKLLVNEDQPDKGLDALLALKPKIIILTRENKLAWFSSIAIAGLTQEWVTAKKTSKQAKMTFSEIDFHNRVNDQRAIEQTIFAKIDAAGLPVLTLDYDELTYSYAHLLILEFLQLPIRKMLSATHKQNSTNLLGRFTNPEEVMAFARARGKTAWIVPKEDAEKEDLNKRLYGLMEKVAEANSTKYEKLMGTVETSLTRIGFKRPLKKIYRWVNLLKFQLR